MISEVKINSIFRSFPVRRFLMPDLSSRKAILCNLRCMLLCCLIGFGLHARAQVLYKAVSAHADTTIFLFGTYSYIPADRFFLDNTIDSLMDRSEAIFTQTYYAEKSARPMVVARAHIRAMSYPDGKRLSDFLSQEDARRVYDYYHKKYRISRSLYRQLSYYIPVVMHQQIAYANDYFVKMDREILKMATRKTIPIYNLDLLPRLNAAYQAMAAIYPPSWLVERIDREEEENQSAAEQLNAYLAQDTAALRQSYQSRWGKDPGAFNQIISRRNRYWIQELEQKGGRINFLFAGIAHLLLEPDGLLLQLQQRGYQIEAIPIRLDAKSAPRPAPSAITP